MSNERSYVPAGYHAVTPYLAVRGASDAIAFYKRVFGASETMRLEDGERLGHAEITIGDSVLMISDEYPEINVVGPQTLGNSPVALHLFVEDVDATFALAVEAGAQVLRPVADQFMGIRNGILRDPFGHRWMIAQRTEDVTRDEIHEGFEEKK